MPETSTIEIIAGPTASGKSSYAMQRGRKADGVIINADSLQIYNALPILTAQPGAEETAEIPHYLYAALAPDQACSAGAWRKMAIPVIEDTLQAGRTPIVVGGSGLYLNALIHGLSPIPDIPDAMRQHANDHLAEIGHDAFLAELTALDPETVKHIDTNNPVRLQRAWEVIKATGTPLIEWQCRARYGPPGHWHFHITAIIPDREALHARSDARFDKMLEMGALDEVFELDQRIQSGELMEDAPITKALGFSELQCLLHGEISRDAALEAAKTRTRQYARRQITWFRNQLSPDQTLETI